MVKLENGWLSPVDQRRRRAAGQNRPGSAKDKGFSRVNIRVERERGDRRDGVRLRTRRPLTGTATGADIEDGDGTKDTTGHRALLIFPLAAMLTFCQIIRKLDLRTFLNFNTITAVMSLIC